MWLKTGTRGDPRVIYVIIAILVFMGLKSLFYSLYNLNDGIEKQFYIVSEISQLMPIDDEIQLQKSKVTKHIGGGREFEEILFSHLPEAKVEEMFLNNTTKNGWVKSKDDNSYTKEEMRMHMAFIGLPREYSKAKHLQNKTIFIIKVEIK